MEYLEAFLRVSACAKGGFVDGGACLAVPPAPWGPAQRASAARADAFLTEGPDEAADASDAPRDFRFTGRVPSQPRNGARVLQIALRVSGIADSAMTFGHAIASEKAQEPDTAGRTRRAAVPQLTPSVAAIVSGAGDADGAAASPPQLVLDPPLPDILRGLVGIIDDLCEKAGTVPTVDKGLLSNMDLPVTYIPCLLPTGPEIAPFCRRVEEIFNECAGELRAIQDMYAEYEFLFDPACCLTRDQLFGKPNVWDLERFKSEVCPAGSDALESNNVTGPRSSTCEQRDDFLALTSQHTSLRRLGPNAAHNLRLQHLSTRTHPQVQTALLSLYGRKPWAFFSALTPLRPLLSAGSTRWRGGGVACLFRQVGWWVGGESHIPGAKGPGQFPPFILSQRTAILRLSGGPGPRPHGPSGH